MRETTVRRGPIPEGCLEGPLHTRPFATDHDAPDHARHAAAGGRPLSADELEGLRAELDATFQEELDDRLPAMANAVETISRTSGSADRGALLEGLARHAHSVKGGAQLVGRTEIARLADALERRIDAAREGRRDLPPIETLRNSLEAVDRLRTADRLDVAQVPSAEVDRLVESLEDKERPL